MKLPVFAKLVLISMFFSLLSILLFLALSHVPVNAVLAYAFYMFVIIAGISFFVAGTITGPVNELKRGFEELMNGRRVEVKVESGDELEELANAFNYMSRVLFEQKMRIKRNEERYRNLVEEINDWVFELDENLNFTYTSPKVKDFLGVESGFVIGKNINDFLKEKLKLRGISERVELVFSDKVVEASFKPFFSNSGKLLGYRAVCRDITERKRTERKLKYLASIVENVVDAVISLDSSGTITSWNRGAEVTFGYSSNEVLGKHYSLLVPKRELKLWQEKMELAEKGDVRFESTGERADGSNIKIEVTLTRVDGNFAIIARDITERRKAEEELRKAYLKLKEKTAELMKSRKELEYLANIVENSSDAIYSVGFNGKITSWNRTAEKLFGWSKEEAIGMHADELLPEELKGETELILRKIGEGITSMTYETRRVSKNGEVIDVEVTISSIHGGYSVIARDITAKIEAESKILRRVLKYDLERGKAYLTDDVQLAREIAEDFLKCGCSVTSISRYFEVFEGKNFRFSERKGKNFVSPELSDVEKLIASLPGWNNLILVELDYLLMKKSFDEVVEFVQNLRDFLHLVGKGFLLFTVDRELLSESEFKLLSKECEVVRTKPSQITIPPKCYEILRHVYMQNRVGENVSFADLMDVFKMSRNTVKKYVRQLESLGLVKVVKDGRFKVVTLTQKGREVFSDYSFEYI